MNAQEKLDAVLDMLLYRRLSVSGQVTDAILSGRVTRDQTERIRELHRRWKDMDETYEEARRIALGEVSK